MSKNNQRTQYNKMSEPNKEVQAPEEVKEPEVTPVVAPEVKSEPEPAAENTKAETPVYTPAIVSRCKKLNVRKTPNPNAEIVAVLNVNTTLNVEMANSTTKYYKVYTAAGVEGFCVREFVDLV